jgi:hypothetical protein
MPVRRASRKIRKPNGALKTARLNLLIRPDLKDWIHKYADKYDKSVSAIVTEHFVFLRERERRERKMGADIEQI